ncbi:hypothetical protein RUM44_004416 [Polyplax serrata]
MKFPEDTDDECSTLGSVQEQRDEMLEAFMLYDKDGDGLIDTRELGTVIRSLGQVLTVCEETDIVAQFAHEKCYEIDYLAFVRLMKTKLRKFDEDVELRESFRRFDKEENGYLDLAKLKSLLLTDGEPLTKATLKDWLDDGAEFIKNGKLYYEDFATFMLSK